jgi:hypothetical protein
MGESTPRSSALARLGHAVERAAAVLLARSDAQARAAGWQVESTGRWNTARVYRDPRYDQLRPRPTPDRARPAPGGSWAGPVRSWDDPAGSWVGREQDRSRR